MLPIRNIATDRDHEHADAVQPVKRGQIGSERTERPCARRTAPSPDMVVPELEQHAGEAARSGGGAVLARELRLEPRFTHRGVEVAERRIVLGFAANIEVIDLR